ncbi:MAG TPA: LuxR C-terminal-related transcriptional regulator [Ornithinibacter sp.]|nr:LuxR C-terminal-related transcriptional regulator [Ornithinibacter sp.]
MTDVREGSAAPSPRVCVPHRIDRAVSRPRLLHSLSAHTTWAVDGPDVLLACAPAGYGKTTVLSELAEDRGARGLPVAWVTCDRDADGASLWNAVVDAVLVAVGEPAPALIGLHAPSGPPHPGFVAALIGVLRQEAPGLILVLDDVHEVVDADALAGIRLLVQWADPGFRIALGCRFEPPVGLHLVRLSGRLHEVRASDLAFTPEESDTFWQGHGLDLDDEVRAAIHTLTEGWPAGLRMAALSLESGEDPALFVEQWSGADRPVADYLAGEVLARLPGDVVTFLQRTSIVDEVDVDLAAHLTGRLDAGALLEDLAQQGALVDSLDRHGTWFRYHSLLRTYLRASLRRSHPDELVRLHATAARWFLDRGQPATALEHACASADPDLVDGILRTHGLGLLLAGAGASLRRAITFAPPGAPATPTTLVHRALLAVDDGDLVQADEALAALAAQPDDGHDRRLTSLRRAASLHRSRLAADLDQARTSGLVAESGTSDLLPPDLDPDVRLLVLGDRGALRLVEGEYALAREDLHRAIDLARAAHLPSIQLYCTNLIAGAHLAQSDFVGARLAAEKAIMFADERGWGRSPGLAYSYSLAGWTSFQGLRPSEAAFWAATAIDLVDAAHATIDVEVEGAARAGEAIIAFDNPAERRAALGRLERATAWRAEHGGSPSLSAIAAPHELRMCLGLGEWQRAERAVARAEERLGSGGDVLVLHAQLAAARGRPMDARRAIAPVLSGRSVPLRETAVTAAWLLEALLASRADRGPAATEALLTALRLAAPTGACRPFFDAGVEIHELLMRLHGRAGHLEPFLDRVVTGITDVLEWQRATASEPEVNPGTPTSAPAGGWLTERELVVLRDLPSMMTLGEIGDAQGISLNTVKTHVRSIYAKLGVGTRREAISSARGIGLL